MALDIFSMFDDHNKVTFNMHFLMWLFMMVCTLYPLRKLWSSFSNKMSAMTLMMQLVSDLVKLTHLSLMGGAMVLVINTFMAILLLNMWGLVPYTFSLSSHLTPTLTLAFILWMSVVLMSLTYNIKAFISHLQPEGAPTLLNPFLCLIELISLMVRPITLGVRVTANLMTGHILMSLLGLGFSEMNLLSSMILIAMGIFYTMFEMAVCFIQAYIFTLLPTLYADEHPKD